MIGKGICVPTQREIEYIMLTILNARLLVGAVSLLASPVLISHCDR